MIQVLSGFAIIRKRRGIIEINERDVLQKKPAREGDTPTVPFFCWLIKQLPIA
jgi:hypothetical protein